MADQRARKGTATALRKMLELLWLLCGPPVSMAGTTGLQRLNRRSSGYVRPLDWRASKGAAPAYWPARLRSFLDELKGETEVVSTANCAPFATPGSCMRF